MSRKALFAPNRADLGDRRSGKHRAKQLNGDHRDLASELEILDDFHKIIPITGDEIDVIETYLGGLIDNILGSVGPNRNEMPCAIS